jgi:glycosyltransferase involved in cell wall biosynthesis
MARPVVHFITRKPLVNNSRIFKQADSLQRAGYDVVLVGVRRGPLPERERLNGLAITRVAHDPLPDRLSHWLRRGGASPTTVHAVPTGPGRARRLALLAAAKGGTLAWVVQSAAFYLRTFRLLTRRAPAPSVVHASDVRTLPVAAAIARRHRVPLVYDAPELYTGMHALPRPYRALLGLQERGLLRYVDRFTVVNPAIGEALRRRYGRAPDAVILNCPPYEPATDSTDIRRTLSLPAGAPVLVYIGGLLPQRGVEQSILALEHLDGAVLVILGEGELQPRLEQLARERGLRDRVVFRRYVPWDQVTGFVRSADVGLVPYQNAGVNHYLSSPTKLFEYLQAGVPVAASDFPFLRSVVAGEGVGTVFDPADPAAIARAVRQILDDPERYRRALPDVRRRYSWQQQERRLLELYASLTPAPRAAPPAGPG